MSLAQERIHISAETVGVSGWDVERLDASPETGATIEHEESGSLYVGGVVVWSLSKKKFPRLVAAGGPNLGT